MNEHSGTEINADILHCTPSYHSFVGLYQQTFDTQCHGKESKARKKPWTYKVVPLSMPMDWTTGVQFTISGAHPRKGEVVLVLNYARH
jgi:hypothetical protein